MHRRFLLAPLALAVFLTGCEWEDFGGSDRFSQDFHFNYALKPGGRLTLENFNGSVEITGWDQDQVDISGAKYAPTPELRDALKIEVQPSADSIYIRTVRPSERRGNLGARYVIRVPRRTQLERIASSNGAIRVTDMEGAARLKTSNGSVRVVNLRGTLDAQTSNGAIELQGVDGGAVLRTSNGRIRAEDVKGGVEAETSNGGIHVQLADTESGRPLKLESSNGSVELVLEHPTRSDVRISTSNGGITVHMPAAMGARLVANTSNSSITTEFDVQMRGSMSKHHLEGTVGSGGPTMDLSTSNGSIRLLKL